MTTHVVTVVEDSRGHQAQCSCGTYRSKHSTSEARVIKAGQRHIDGKRAAGVAR